MPRIDYWQVFLRYLLTSALLTATTYTTSGAAVGSDRTWAEQCHHIQTVHTVQSAESPRQLMHASYPGIDWSPMWALIALCNPQIAAFDPGSDGQTSLPQGLVLKLPTFQIPTNQVYSPVAAASSHSSGKQSVSSICDTSTLDVIETVSWLQLAVSAYPTVKPAVMAATLLAVCNPQAKLLPNQLLEPDQQLLGLRVEVLGVSSNSRDRYTGSSSSQSSGSSSVAVSAADTVRTFPDSSNRRHDDNRSAKDRRRSDKTPRFETPGHSESLHSKHSQEPRSGSSIRTLDRDTVRNSATTNREQERQKATAGSITARRPPDADNLGRRSPRQQRPDHRSSGTEEAVLPPAETQPPIVDATTGQELTCQVTTLTSSGPVRQIQMSQSCSWLSDGCSGPSSILQYQDVLTPCCHAHDYCYFCAHTIGWSGVTARQECDRKMKSNMLAVCQSSYDVRGWWDWDHKWNKFWCENTAEVMFAAVWAYQEVKAGSVSYAGEYDCSGDAYKLAATDFCFHR